MVKNRIYINKVIVTCFLLLISFILSDIVEATPSTKQRIYDFAGLLTSEEVKQLEDLSEKYSRKRQTDFIILTTNDTKGKDIVPYMEDFYDEKALGYDRPHGNTAILTIDMKNRDVYLAGFHKGKEYLDDYRLDLVRDKISPDLSQGNYYEAFYSFIKISYKYMGIRPGVNPDNLFLNLWFQIAVSLGLAGIVVSIMAYRTGGKVTVGDSTYRDYNNSKVIDKRDRYLNTTVSKTKIASNNSSGGKSGGTGGGGGGGVSRGGHSHSGSRGKF